MPTLTRNGVSVGFVVSVNQNYACAYAQPGDILTFGVNAKSVKGGDPTQLIDATVFSDNVSTDVAMGVETLTYTVGENDSAIFVYTYSN